MRLDQHVSLFLALAAALAAADSTAPTLRGARVRDRVWVRRPGGGRHIELVPSLEELCEREQLDLGAMREVAAGSMEEHEGWSCGTASECESEAAEAASGAVADGELTPPSPPAGRAASSRRKPKAAASERTAVLSKARGKTAAPAEAAEAAAAGAAVPAGGGGGTMSKMLVQLVASTTASKAVKRLDKAAPDFVQKVRMAFYVLAGVRLLLEALVSWRIDAAADDTLLGNPPAADPMAAMLAAVGLGGGGGGDQTVVEYDRSQLNRAANSYKANAILMFVLHALLGWSSSRRLLGDGPRHVHDASMPRSRRHSTLIYSATSSVVDFLYHPLFAIHVLGRSPIGHLARPFKAPGGLPFKPPEMPAPAEAAEEAGAEAAAADEAQADEADGS